MTDTNERVLQIINEITLNLMGQRESLVTGILEQQCCEVLLGDQIEAVDSLIGKLMQLIQVINSSSQKVN